VQLPQLAILQICWLHTADMSCLQSSTPLENDSGACSSDWCEATGLCPPAVPASTPGHTFCSASTYCCRLSPCFVLPLLWHICTAMYRRRSKTWSYCRAPLKELWLFWFKRRRQGRGMQPTTTLRSR
jgi:hypothetical protein